MTRAARKVLADLKVANQLLELESDKSNEMKVLSVFKGKL